MSKIEFSGPLGYRLRSLLVLNRIALGTYARHLIGRKIAPDWDAYTETGVLFVRHQFTTAMTHPDIKKGRAIFESLLTFPDDVYEVSIANHNAPMGRWYTPETVKTDKVLLYFHGGGYTFRSRLSDHFAQMLAHHTGARVFMPFYRLTPEHPHPAQSEDALTAWQYLTENDPAANIVAIGDSAGGHMALTLLKTLQDRGDAQPALCIGLCPWTDIGARGASMQTNNRFDLVQGWMAMQFGEWLNPNNRFERTALSPINWDFSGLAPIYLQAGGREMLHDMIAEFAQVQADLGARVMLDTWADMAHDFQAADSFHASSTQAVARISDAIQSLDAGAPTLAPLSGITRIDNLNPAYP